MTLGNGPHHHRRTGIKCCLWKSLFYFIAMSTSATSTLIIILVFVLAYTPDKFCKSQEIEEPPAETTTEIVQTTTEINPETETVSEEGANGNFDETSTVQDVSHKLGFIDMEIISLEVDSRTGNSVQLSWGRPGPGYNLNWTYGLYYGTNLDDLEEPKLQTKELCATVSNLTFCTQYVFGVGVVEETESRPGAGKRRPNNYIRRMSTFVDPKAPPQNLRIEFIPQEHPALLIKWSASCPNVGLPLAYNVYIYQKNPSHMTISTTPKTTSSDLSHLLRDVTYGQTYSIKISTDFLGANSTSLISYKVPLFLQPYKIRITTQPDGTFIVYWREPFVPFYVGRYYYEIFAYPGRGLDEAYEVFKTKRPVLVFKGNYTEYTIMLGLRSERSDYSSFLTEPVWKSVYGGEAEPLDPV